MYRSKQTNIYRHLYLYALLHPLRVWEKWYPDIKEQAPWNPDLDYIIPPSTKENLFLFFFPPRLGNEDCKMKGKHLLE